MIVIFLQKHLFFVCILSEIYTTTTITADDSCLIHQHKNVKEVEKRLKN